MTAAPAPSPPAPERPGDPVRTPAVDFHTLMLTSPRNTGRPPDARWRRAAARADHPGASRDALEDEWGRTAFDYLARLRRGDDRLAADLPAVDAAYRLHVSGDKQARGELEGRLLAGQTGPEAAAACGLAAEVVDAYQALFFDVAGKLDARLWVVLYAIGPRCVDGLAESDTDVILRRAGFLYGSAGLGRMLSYYRVGCRVPARLDDLTRAELEGLHDRLWARAMVLAWVLPAEKVARVALLDRLLGELRAVLDRWPVGGEVPAGVSDGWPGFREVAGAAATGRGLRKLLTDPRAA